MSHGGHYKFDKVFKNHPILVEVDASRFDIRSIREVVLCSFSIFRSCYPPGAEADSAFIALADNFINGNIISPDGNSFVSSKGIKSGDALTSPIGSICS